MPRASVISVLLPFRDAHATIAEAARSVLADMGAADELVAVDDGSTDASARVLEELDDRRLVLVRAAPPGAPVGIARALSFGLDVARGEWIARMDADDVSLPGRLAAERALLLADRSLGAVGVRVELFGDESEGMAGYVAWQNRAVTPEDHARAIFVEAPLCHPSTMLRREALERANGWRDAPWPEDWDLWMRLHAAGFGLAKVPRVLFRWRRSRGAVTTTDPRCARPALVRARAHHLAPLLRARAGAFTIWGAGDTGKRLARALEAHDLRPAFFVDVDPRKRSARGASVVPAESAMARARAEGLFVVVAVGAPGARDIVRARLFGAGFEEGASFVCAA